MAKRCAISPYLKAEKIMTTAFQNVETGGAANSVKVLGGYGTFADQGSQGPRDYCVVEGSRGQLPDLLNLIQRSAQKSPSPRLSHERWRH